MPLLLPAPLQTPCQLCPLRAISTFRPLEGEELAFISRFKVGELRVPAGEEVIREGEASRYFYTVLSGWGIRHKTLEDGRRQILNVALAGDLVGLQSAVLGEMQHSVSALSNMLLCVFERKRIWELYTGQPGLAFDLTWLAAREERILDEHLLSVGQRSSSERVAYLLLFLFARAERRGLTRGNALSLPLTQQHIAETLGMSLVHTNRTLNRLVRTQLIKWENRRFQIRDRSTLESLAGWHAQTETERPYL